MTTATRLRLQPCEPRDVPATLSPDGTLLIEGTQFADRVTVQYRSDVDVVEVTTETRFNAPDRFDAMGNPIPVPGKTRSVEYFAAPEVRDIRFLGFLGGDVFENFHRLPAGGRVIADGHGGGDRLLTVAPYGAEDQHAATLAGGAGNDVLIGSAAIDWMFGGAGHDSLYAGNGADFLYGEADNDLLRGGEGNDRMFGDGGVDNLWGGGGNDLMWGGLAGDAMFGEAGNDTLFGDDGARPAMGGHDWLDGGEGDDALIGMNGNDLLGGGIGADTLQGEAGNDRIDAGMDNDLDVVMLGVGADELIVHWVGGPPTWVTFLADDVRDFTPGVDRYLHRYNGGLAMP